MILGNTYDKTEKCYSSAEVLGFIYATGALVAGALEALTIWVATTYLGKYPMLPFIAWVAQEFGFIGVVLVVALRSLLVVLALRWRFHHLNLALFTWWYVWAWENLIS